ncbi:MAG: hypothetical protein NC132_02615 [Corallococcus sp.]|nr:hypothetical protein [Corallococcus sp.]MCM1359001.1 hypothetical protein [Corallococcus sp.]MCM1394990.1 hypothetical protein [Corallococcus sp.]
MFKKTSVKRLTIILAALLVCMAVLFAACSPAKPFKQRELPSKATPVGNGGIAVLYGEWLYYVNGNISGPDAANNAYSEDLRSGSVVRIKLADLESKVLSVNQMDMSSTEKTKAIQAAVRDNAEMVVPNVYYTANTVAELNGIYIFGDRIYITTPNDQLDSKGNVLTSQLVLASYNLGGGDRQNHLVFETNAPALKLAQIGEDVYATYVLDGKLMSLKIGDKEPTQIAEKITSQQFSGNYVYYLDEDGSICQFQIGGSEAKVLVPLVQKEGHEDHNHKSYAIQKVNNEYVYYTITDSSTLGEPEYNGEVLFYATAPVTEENHVAVINYIPSSTYFCYGTKVIYTQSDSKAPSDQTRYLIVAATGNGSESDGNLETLRNERASVTLTRLDGSTLYYTMNSVTYTLDLSDTAAEPVPYAYSLSTSATGWALPDVLQVTDGDTTTTYVFTISTDSVSVVKFNSETKKNSTSTNITLVEEVKDDEDNND